MRTYIMGDKDERTNCRIVIDFDFIKNSIFINWSVRRSGNGVHCIAVNWAVNVNVPVAIQQL